MNSILKNIDSPEDIKSLKSEELRLLAREIRRFLIDSISHTGGHLASNLGVVELTIAMHYCFDSPEDKFIFDVGHQSYVHKILTGRKDEMHTIRQYGGLSGFPKRSESEHDIFNTGHSSTSISAALGLARKRDLCNEDHHVVSVIGDGSFTGGIAFEALNNAASLDSNFIIIINDNQMSIAENVGGISVYLDSIRTGNIYNEVKDDVQKVLKRIPKVGENVVNAVRDVKEGFKQLIIPGMFFEEMGFTYLGPINGNNIKQLITTLNNAKRVQGPTIIHVNTIKGKGYPPAEKYPSRYHGVAPFNKASGLPKVKSSSKTYSNMFGDTMIELASENEKIVAISAAMPSGTGLSMFRKMFPDRFFDVGIAEQHAVTFAGGLAVAGLKPYVAIYSSFLQRAYDQIMHDICLQKLPVVFCIDRSGLVGADGETHQGVFDTSYLSHLPNITIMAPKDGDELKEMLVFANDYDQGPIAIKYPRGGYNVINFHQDVPIEYGEFEIIKKGEGTAILGVGSLFENAYYAYEKLVEDGMNPTLINPRFLKKFDKKQLLSLLDDHENIVVIEENALIGGYGSEVLRALNGSSGNVLLCGIEDVFVQHGNRDLLLDKSGLSVEKLHARISEFVRRNNG